MLLAAGQVLLPALLCLLFPQLLRAGLCFLAWYFPFVAFLKLVKQSLAQIALLPVFPLLEPPEICLLSLDETTQVADLLLVRLLQGLNRTNYPQKPRGPGESQIKMVDVAPDARLATVPNAADNHD
jgi:hypothetical protein